MPLTGPQAVSLARLLGHLRPDWHDAGTHDAVTTLATQTHEPIELCRQALRAAANAANLTPTSITWRHQRAPELEQFAPCPDHNGMTRRPDGTYACCWAENAEPDPYRHAPHPPPPGLRAQVAALLNAPAYDRLPARTSDRQNATPDGATREGDPR